MEHHTVKRIITGWKINVSDSTIGRFSSLVQDCLFQVKAWAEYLSFLSLAKTGNIPVVDFA